MKSRTQNINYTIGELASLAGVSVRTLRYYDQIDLLKPSWRDDSDYRRYSFKDLLHLQQILFFREMDLSLNKIKVIINDPEINLLELLHQHHENLENEIKRLQKLQMTIGKTIQKLQEEDKMPLTDADLYAGFSKEKIDRYHQEVRETYDPEIVQHVDNKVRNMSKDQWQLVQQECGIIAQGLAELIDHDPKESEVQVWIKRQHAWIENFFSAPAEVFRGLGKLYATHDEFHAFYDQFKPGLADFMHQAMDHYADTVLKNS